MSSVRITQQPRCRHRTDYNFEVVKVQRGKGKPHHYLKCSVCETHAKNAAKPKNLIRWDPELRVTRLEEIRRRKAGDQTLRKRAA